MELIIFIIFLVVFYGWRAYDSSRPFEGKIEDIDMAKLLLDKSSPREKDRKMRKGYYNKTK